MDTGNLWQAVLGEIELGVSSGNYVTWFKSTRLLKIKDGCVVVGAPNVFIKQHLERRFDSLISKTLKKNGVKFDKIEYKILPTSSLHRRNEDDSVVFRGQSQAKSAAITSSLTHTYRQGLNKRYTFDNFIVGSGNELAYAACQAVVQSPGTKYNPLFLFGGVGIGKTHLIQAVGNGVVAKNKNAHIVYVSAEQFVQEFLDAIRYKKKYRFCGAITVALTF